MYCNLNKLSGTNNYLCIVWKSIKRRADNRLSWCLVHCQCLPSSSPQWDEEMRKSKRWKELQSWSERTEEELLLIPGVFGRRRVGLHPRVSLLLQPSEPITLPMVVTPGHRQYPSPQHTITALCLANKTKETHTCMRQTWIKMNWNCSSSCSRNS